MSQKQPGLSELQNPLEVIDPNEDSNEPFVQMIWADDEFEDDGKSNHRKMGREPRAYEDYIKESNRRIENWSTELLKHPAGSLKRRRFRNRITALRARMKLKTENKNQSRTIWTL